MSAIKTHFLSLYSMALADNSFHETELAAFYNIAEKHRISKSEVDHILLNPATVSFEIPDTLETKIEYLYDYAQMIHADGVVEDIEVSTLEKFCLKFEFQEENVPGLRDFLLEAAKNKVPTVDIINFVTQTV